MVRDIASGINENRRGLDALIDLSRRGEITAVVAEYKDRLALFGFNYLEELFHSYVVDVICVEEDDERTYEEELVEDMLSIVTSFSARLYGRRGGRKVGEKTEEGLAECR